MKMTVLCAGIATPHAGWAPIDELAQLLAHYFHAELLGPRQLRAGWLHHLGLARRTHYQQLPASGGDVLFVVAHSPGDLTMIRAIPGVRSQYARIHGFVTDSYFEAGFPAETALYDAITVTAHEDMAYVKSRFGIPVHHLYQGADCLRWAPRRGHARDIDLIAYGRTPPSYHACFSARFHDAASPHLYLHSPLGHLHGAEVHRERGMLFKLLQRTRLSLAFHLLVEPQGDRPRSMMVTSRWLESLLSGCIVAGRRPVSRMAEEMLNWPGATVELSNDPQAAADELVNLLARNDELEEQRRSNIFHMASQHDWRYRIRDLCKLLGLPAPAALGEDIERLQALCADYAAGG